MKTSSIILAALLFSTGVVLAQNEKKPKTVRIKKVETVNGVTKVTDTSFVVTDEASLKGIPGGMGIEEIKGLPGMNATMIRINDASGEMKVETSTGGEWTSKEMDQDMTKAFARSEGNGDRKIVIVESETESVGGNAEKMSPKQYTKVIVIKHIYLEDPTDEEIKQLGKTAQGKSELEVSQLNVAPNPSQGGLTGISLFLPKKGPTTITVYSPTGQVVYNENLGDFTGRYQKEIDLGGKTSGIYFLSVKQNNETLTKKIILE